MGVWPKPPLAILASAGSLRLFLPPNAWLVVMLALANFRHYSGSLTLSLETTQCAVEGLILSNFNL